MNLVIADDHLLFRDALKSLLEIRGHQVVGVARTGREAIELTRRLRPDLVLMDLSMPEMDGIAATKIITSEIPDAKVVVLTASNEDEDLFEAIKAGAVGYLLKDLQAEHFFALLEGAQRGEPAMTPLLARKLLAEFKNPRSVSQKETDPDALTQREFEVLETMVVGTTTNRALAKHFGVSENTIKFHMRNILDKLHLHNRAQVVSHALRNKIVEPTEQGK